MIYCALTAFFVGGCGWFAYLLANVNNSGRVSPTWEDRVGWLLIVVVVVFNFLMFAAAGARKARKLRMYSLIYAVSLLVWMLALLFVAGMDLRTYSSVFAAVALLAAIKLCVALVASERLLKPRAENALHEGSENAE